MPFPVAQTTVPEHWRVVTFHWLALPKLSWDLPSLSWALKAPGYLWGGLPINPLMPVPHWRKKKNISHRQLSQLRGSSSHFRPFSRRGLNPIKPVCEPDQPDGRIDLTASAFNQLYQYTNSPGRSGYCYAELAVFFPSGSRNHRQYSLRLPMEGWPGWVGVGGWLYSETVYLADIEMT